MKSLILALSILTIAPVIAQEATPPVPDVSKALKSKPVQASKIVTVDEAEKLIKETKGLIILDVRMPEEFAHEHIKGAHNVNVHGVDFEKEIAALDQTKPVLVHCAAGRRSALALEEMAGKVHFPQVYHLADGFNAWKAAGKPFEEKPLPKPVTKGSKETPAPAK